MEQHRRSPFAAAPTYQSQIGDRVRVLALGKIATVTSMPGTSGEFYVRMGGLAVCSQEIETLT
jgi:dsDNA-specific endonuclease/ATPase MutS2